MKKHYLLLAVLSFILLSAFALPVQAAPSAESYQQVIYSVPSIGRSVASLPDYLTPQPARDYIATFDGTYGELEIHGNVDPRSGIVTFLLIKPVSGETNTSDIEGSVAEALVQKYGRPSTKAPGEAYIWSKGRFQLQYAIKSGVITGSY